MTDEKDKKMQISKLTFIDCITKEKIFMKNYFLHTAKIRDSSVSLYSLDNFHWIFIFSTSKFLIFLWPVRNQNQLKIYENVNIKIIDLDKLK